VQEFMRFANFYKKFIRGYSGISTLITNFIKKDKAFNWTENQQFAFDKLKRRFLETLVLTIFNPKKSITLKIDVSDYAIGVCII
jgi:RNase H-like domain found in reverse transcriptase